MALAYHKAMNVELRKHYKLPTVKVAANDYEYEGWVVAVFNKRMTKARVVVEDTCGRLFIHNLDQLEEINGPALP